MRKLICTALLVIGLGASTFSQDASVPGDGSECEPGGLANQYCPYWDVTYEILSGFWPWSSATVKITCQTGGSFQCKKK